ncbi:MAG: YkgJ family cysteine cluster protein [Methanosarcinales archaeon]|nr:MAG: YkgJ family cysteine cluster protein [Methanosarcinales archaeon]
MRLQDCNYTLEELREEVTLGLLYVHHQLGANTGKALEASSFLYALIELLIQRGIITEEELNEEKIAVAERLVGKFREIGMGAAFQEDEQDKHGFDCVQIDCESRMHLCKAACCKMNFALSRQDIEERIVRWDLGHPYMIAKDVDGYCVHLDKRTHTCRIWENRPVPCRAFDCRTDKRIWLDSEKMILNPKLPDIFKREQGD